MRFSESSAIARQASLIYLQLANNDAKKVDHFPGACVKEKVAREWNAPSLRSQSANYFIIYVTPYKTTPLRSLCAIVRLSLSSSLYKNRVTFIWNEILLFNICIHKRTLVIRFDLKDAIHALYFILIWFCP